MNTPTPRTDEAWAAWPYAGSGISVHIGRELERELTAVTKERDRLLEEREQWSLSSAFKEIDMMGIRYAAAEMHHANNMKEVTEQRDEALSDLEFRCDLYALQTKQLDDVREQRDKLAEALRKIKNAGGTYNDPYDEFDFIDWVTFEALQSLDQPTKP